MTFTAADAKRLVAESNDINGPIGRAETEAILKRIEAAARRGEISMPIEVSYENRKMVIRRLREAGFQVTSFPDQQDGDNTTVTWS